MGHSYQNVVIIINPASGKQEPILNTINDVFHHYSIPWSIRITHKFGDAARFAREAATAGADLVVGYGGDGTQMEVANGLIGSSVPLGILPGGTGNAMAFELGIPRDLRQAVELLCTSQKTRPVDLARANNKYFMLRLYSGVEEEQKTSREMKDKYGVLAYPMSVIGMLRDLNPAHYRLTIDGQLVEEDGVVCFVINAGSLGGVPLSFDAQIDVSDGLLDVFMVNTDLSSLGAATGRFLRVPTEKARWHYWRGREIVMEAEPRQTIWVDGELLGPTPVTITAVPAAIHVVVP
jgi:diacylglycerol kinase (ATP)